MYLRCVLNDVSPYTTVKYPKYPRKERTSLEKNARGRETLEIQIRLGRIIKTSQEQKDGTSDWTMSESVSGIPDIHSERFVE
jgi:hypothetical protein